MEDAVTSTPLKWSQRLGTFARGRYLVAVDMHGGARVLLRFGMSSATWEERSSVYTCEELDADGSHWGMILRTWRQTNGE